MYSLTFGSFLWSAPVQDETAHHCFLYFIKLFYIFRALHTARLEQSRGSAEAARMQSWSSARPLCFHSACQHEREGACSGGFGFQTKVKDHFLNQRRWTCWYSCRENMQVLSATDSFLVWLFFLFSFWKACHLCCLPHVTLWRLSLFF